MIICFDCGKEILPSDHYITVCEHFYYHVERFHFACVIEMLTHRIAEHYEDEEPEECDEILDKPKRKRDKKPFDIVMGLADDLGLTAKDTLGDMIGALKDEEAEEEGKE